MEVYVKVSFTLIWNRINLSDVNKALESFDVVDKDY